MLGGGYAPLPGGTHGEGTRGGGGGGLAHLLPLLHFPPPPGLVPLPPHPEALSIADLPMNCLTHSEDRPSGGGGGGAERGIPLSLNCREGMVGVGGALGCRAYGGGLVCALCRPARGVAPGGRPRRAPRTQAASPRPSLAPTPGRRATRVARRRGMWSGCCVAQVLARETDGAWRIPPMQANFVNVRRTEELGEEEVEEESRPAPELQSSGILREARTGYASLIERIPPFGIEPREDRLPLEPDKYSSKSLKLFNFAPTSSSDTLRTRRVDRIDLAFQGLGAPLGREASESSQEDSNSPTERGPALKPRRPRLNPLERVERLLTDSPPSPPGWNKPPSRAANRALTALVFNKEKMKKNREKIRNTMQAKEGQGSDEDSGRGKGEAGSDEGVTMLGVDPLEAKRRAEMLKWASERVDKRMEAIHRQMNIQDPAASPSGSLSPTPRKTLKTLGSPQTRKPKKKVTFGFAIQEDEEHQSS